jgi:ribonuclease BN (tRNA processing enzyme)
MGPGGLLEYYRNLQAIWEHRVDPAGFDLSIEEWAGGVFSWPGCIIGAAPTSHSISNLAWRIDAEDNGDCGVVITGDGQSTDELMDLASSANHVLVAESAAGPGELLEGHMNPAQAGELARRCSSKKLILCHINPGPGSEAIRKEAVAHYDGDVIVAEDGMEIDIS